MFFDKWKISCGAACAVRSVADFFPQHFLQTEFCLWYVALRFCETGKTSSYLLVEIPLNSVNADTTYFNTLLLPEPAAVMQEWI